MDNEKTWNNPDANRPHFGASSAILEQSRAHLWYIKAWLTGQIGGATLGLWTVVGSSDGVTAGMDGVDRWGAVYDGTKIIRSSGAVAHSWMVLRSPGITAGGLVNVPFYIILDFSSTADYIAVFIGCKALPTGGTITARPTSTDEVNFTPTEISSVSVATPKLSGFLASDGTFWILWAPPGAGMIQIVTTFNVLAECRANDLWPVAFGSYFSNGGAGAMAGICGAFQSRRFDGSVASTATMTWEQGYSNALDPAGASGIAATGDAADGSYITLLTHLGLTVAGQRSFKGRFQDTVIAAPGDNISGDSFPPGGAPTDQVLGHLRMPIAGTPITL